MTGKGARNDGAMGGNDGAPGVAALTNAPASATLEGVAR